MKTLTVLRTGIERDPKLLSTYKLGLEVTGSQNIDKEVFVKQRQRTTDNTTTDVFVAVCTPAQLEDLEVDAPDNTTTYFRSSKMEVVSENPNYLFWVLDNVINELQFLCDSAEALDVVSTGSVTYTISSNSIPYMTE